MSTKPARRTSLGSTSLPHADDPAAPVAEQSASAAPEGEDEGPEEEVAPEPEVTGDEPPPEAVRPPADQIAAGLLRAEAIDRHARAAVEAEARRPKPKPVVPKLVAPTPGNEPKKPVEWIVIDRFVWKRGASEAVLSPGKVLNTRDYDIEAIRKAGANLREV